MSTRMLIGAKARQAFIRGQLSRLRRDERGLASVELMAVMPVFAAFIVGVITLAGLAYYHLALLTTANDCAVMIAHEPAEYYNAATLVQGAYDIGSELQGHLESGGSLAACSAFTNWNLYALRYTVHIPSQPYQSLWP